MLIRYHVFTNGKDDWFSKDEYGKAEQLYQSYEDQDLPCRLYEEVYENEEALENDEMEDEECLFAHGYLPD